jgi:hypothetical protein
MAPQTGGPAFLSIWMAPHRQRGQHVLAWREAPERRQETRGLADYRRIGMSGGLLVTPWRARPAAAPRPSTPSSSSRHAEAYLKAWDRCVLCRARSNCSTILRSSGAAPSPPADAAERRPIAGNVGVRDDLVVITRDQVRYAKPDLDLFRPPRRNWASRFTIRSWWATACGLTAARRARAIVSACSPAATARRLERAGAYRVYQDPRLLAHLDE